MRSALTAVVLVASAASAGPVADWHYTLPMHGGGSVAVGLRETGGSLHVRLEPVRDEAFAFTLAPVWATAGKRGMRVRGAGGTARMCSGRAEVGVSVWPGRVCLRIKDDGGQLKELRGVLRDPSSLYPCRVWLRDGVPATHGGQNVLQSAVGRASSTNCNALYSVETFYGFTIETIEGCLRIRPVKRGYAIALSPGKYTIRPADLWPVVGWRPPDQGATYGIGGKREGYLVPREWLHDRRPFPWETLSPVQLPFISITDPAAFDDVKAQVDFLERELRDWGFYCYGEWPLTQRNPEYDPAAMPAYLEGNRRTCDYAHAHRIRILRWLTDPDIVPSWYPKLYKQFLDAGWFSPFDAAPGQYLLDYSNPEVCTWLRGTYEQLGRTGPDFYWVDNNHPTKPVREPNRFPPDVFRNFYRAIQRGLLASGRNDILIRSGASVWADYSAVGILDVYAPGPDVQNDWEEQQIFVARELAMRDYLCHFNLWRRSIDDYFPAGPMTIDQTRAMASLIALTGISFTTTDIGLPKIPPERLADLRRLVPVPTVRPLDLFRFRGSLPTWWVQHRTDHERAWALVGVFNWGLHDEECPFASFEELGLGPDAEHFVYDVWSQRPVGFFSSGIGLRMAPATGRLLAVHPVGDRPFLVATDRHATVGAAEIRDLRWERAAARLSGQLTAGVAGQTFHLTLYVPDRWRVVKVEVGQRGATWGKEGPLVQVPLVCEGSKLAWGVTFTRAMGVGSTSPSPAASLPDADVLLGRARTGAAVFVRAPSAADANSREWQRRTGVRWGLYRPRLGGPARLTVATPRAEAVEGAVFRTAEIGFRVGIADAVARKVGKGVLVVLSPEMPKREEEHLRAQVRRYCPPLGKGGLAGWTKSIAAQWRTALDRATTAVVDWRVENGSAVGSLRVSPWLKGRQLTFHLRRVLPSIQPDYWGVPEVSVAINGTDLPRHLNPCRPHSPPENWDMTTFRVPDGLLRFDASNTLVIRPAKPAAKPDLLLADLKDAVELRIEDVAVAGQTELGELPRIAFSDVGKYDALLGLDGGLRVLAEAPGVEVRVSRGKPYTGWPLRPGGVIHCVYDEQRLVLEIEVPANSTGFVEAYAYDADDYRTEDVCFERREPVRLDRFGTGKWLRFPFGRTESHDGKLLLEATPERCANAVLSRVRVVLD